MPMQCNTTPCEFCDSLLQIHDYYIALHRGSWIVMTRESITVAAFDTKEEAIDNVKRRYDPA